MAFKSERQKKWMYENKPELAKEFAKNKESKPKKETTIKKIKTI